jgi:hypothetical protein
MRIRIPNTVSWQLLVLAVGGSVGPAWKGGRRDHCQEEQGGRGGDRADARSAQVIGAVLSKSVHHL